MDEFLELFSDIQYPARDDPSTFFFCPYDKEFEKDSFAFRLMNNKLKPPEVKDVECQLNELVQLENSLQNNNSSQKPQARRYIPCMKKVVYPKASNFDFFEMKECHFLYRGFLREQLNPQQQQVLSGYLDRVKEERTEFQTFVSTLWRRLNFQRYMEMPEAAKLITEQYHVRRIHSALTLYPNLYNRLFTIPLVYDDKKNPIRVELQKCLHDSGDLEQLRIPPLKEKQVLEKCEILSSRTSQENTLHYQQPVSLDELAAQLALENEANFVISSSGFKKLVDNHYPNFATAWQLPVVVKEFPSSKGTKRVVFIDKAFPPTNLSTADRSRWFTKKAVVSFLKSSKANKQDKKSKNHNEAQLSKCAENNETQSIDVSDSPFGIADSPTKKSSPESPEVQSRNESSPIDGAQASISFSDLAESPTVTSCNRIDESILESSLSPSAATNDSSISDLLSPNESSEQKVGMKKGRKTKLSKDAMVVDVVTMETQDSPVPIKKARGRPKKLVATSLQSDSTSPCKRNTRSNTLDSSTGSHSQDSETLSTDCHQSSSGETSPISETISTRSSRKKSTSVSESPKVSVTTRSTKSLQVIETKGKTTRSRRSSVKSLLAEDSPTNEAIKGSASKNQHTVSKQSRSKKDNSSTPKKKILDSENADVSNVRQTRSRKTSEAPATPEKKKPAKKPIKKQEVADISDSDSDNLVIDFEDSKPTVKAPQKDAETKEWETVKSYLPPVEKSSTQTVTRSEKQKKVAEEEEIPSLPTFNFYREVSDEDKVLETNKTSQDNNMFVSKSNTSTALCEVASTTGERKEVLQELSQNLDMIETEDALVEQDKLEYEGSPGFGTRSNVTYNLWTVHKEDNSRVLLKSGTRALTLLIRTKIVGTVNENNSKRKMSPVTKVEYNPEYGASCSTLSEATQMWAELFIKPYADLIRVRVAHSDYEVMMMEKLRLADSVAELKRNHNVTPQCCYNTLYSVLVKLADLEVGNYVLCHEPRDGAFAVLHKASNMSFGSYSLQWSYQKKHLAPRENCPFIPIDTFILTPAHHFNKSIPATFIPKQQSKANNRKLPSVPVQKTMFSKSKGRKNHGKKKGDSNRHHQVN